MESVTMHEAKTELSRFVLGVVEGEEIVIAPRRAPWVRLVALAGSPGRRTLEAAKSRVAVTDDLDEPLEEFHEHR